MADSSNVVHQTFEITHSEIPGFSAVKNFPLALTVGELKAKLHMLVGTDPKFMTLQWKNGSEVKATLSNDASKLEEFLTAQPSTTLNIHVVDSDPSKQVSELQSGSAAPVQLSEAQYNSRPDTFRKWKEQNPSPAKPAEQAKWTVGQRCEIETNGGKEPNRKGTIKFVGSVKFGEGIWVGIHLDEAKGKNDGNVQGVKYFDSLPNHGVMVKQALVKPETGASGEF